MKRKRHNVEQGPPFGLTDDYSAHPVNTAERVKAGPNRYAMMKDRIYFYGDNFDYRIMDGDVFMPACEVAQEWLRSKVGEDQHWYTDLDGWCGIAVSDLEAFKAAAERDGLIDEVDYVENMNEDQEKARQWE